MSHGLVPSKSTVYVSNLPFSLTNNDLHKMFEQYGRIIKVTVLKDKKTRESKGVAFVLFLNVEDAHNFVSSFHGKQIGGRTISVKIATDNGRSREFIRKKIYQDKTKCYECGDEGHLSYECPKNTLGYRKPPPKKKKKRSIHESQEADLTDYLRSSDDDYEDSPKKRVFINEDEGTDEEEEEPDLETLSAAIRIEQEKYSTSIDASANASVSAKKRIRKSAYFSDEEELSD